MRMAFPETRRILNFFRSELNLNLNLAMLGLLHLFPGQFWILKMSDWPVWQVETDNMDGRDELMLYIKFWSMKLFTGSEM